MFVLLALSQLLGCGTPAQANEGQSGLEVVVYEYECVEDASGSEVVADLPREDVMYQVEICSTELSTCLPAYRAESRMRREGLELHIPCGGGFGVHADQVRLVVIQ